MTVYNKMIESAIEGLVLLGKTREEALEEIRKNEDLRYQIMLYEDMKALDRKFKND